MQSYLIETVVVAVPMMSDEQVLASSEARSMTFFCKPGWTRVGWESRIFSKKEGNSDVTMGGESRIGD